MAAQSLTLPVIDADGHLVESVCEMAEFMEPFISGKIERTITREDLTLDQKRAVLADNARRFH